MTISGQVFNNNQGCGGFESGGYDKLAIHPTDTNWTRQSRFHFDKKPRVLWQRIFTGGSLEGNWVDRGFSVDSNANLIISECSDEFLFKETGRVLSIAPNGEEQVIFEAGYHLKAPVIGKSGVIYVATTGGSETKPCYKLFCLWPDGQMKWEYDFEDILFCRPVLDQEGNVYIVDYSRNLFCLNNQGELKWVLRRKSGYWYGPVIDSRGQIYIGTNYEKTLMALDKGGNVLWEIKIGDGRGMYPPVIDRDGVIYITSNNLYAISWQGNVLWSYTPVKALVSHSPAMDEENNLYTNLTSGHLISLNREGRERWIVSLKGLPNCGPPVLDVQGNCFQQSMISDFDRSISWLEAFNPVGEKLWECTFKGMLSGTVIADDNLMYCVTNWITPHKAKGPETYKSNWVLYAIEGK